MAKVCELCSKQTATGNNRSHSRRATKRKFFPNLFSKNIFIQEIGAFLRMRICARCIKTVAKHS